MSFEHMLGSGAVSTRDGLKRVDLTCVIHCTVLLSEDRQVLAWQVIPRRDHCLQLRAQSSECLSQQEPCSEFKQAHGNAAALQTLVKFWKAGYSSTEETAITRTWHSNRETQLSRFREREI